MIMMDINIGSLIRQRANISPEMEGVVGEQRLTFRQINNMLNRAAHWMREQGLQVGDPTSICCRSGGGRCT